METKIDRRNFNKKGLQAIGAGALLSFPGVASAAPSANTSAKIGFIGVGSRGKGLLRLALNMPGIQVSAICDINEKHLDAAVQVAATLKGQTPEGYSKGPYDYRRMLERDDLDAVLIATPTEWHSIMSVDALQHDKHVGCEVPAAVTLQECMDIVKARKKSRADYMMLENYVYTQNNLLVYNMAQQRAFGDLYYGQCAYIHDVRSMRFESDGSLTWRGKRKLEKFGNLYPTHSLGPVAKWMDINKTDRIVSVSSRMSKPMVLHEYAIEKFGAGHPNAALDFKAGDMNVTLLKTEKGKLITVYYDTDSPRPREISYQLQGTKGIYDSRDGVYIEPASRRDTWDPISHYKEKYMPSRWEQFGRQAAQSGHGGSDFFTILDFVEMVQGKRKSFIDVYDAAVWSAVMPLSAESIKNQCAVEMPDFTRL